jgi:N-acetylmuramoyl-L-alanine amidase
MHRVYISASTQKENIGVGEYGTEQDRMMQLSDRVAYWLKTQKIEVFRNQPNWSLEQTVKDCNSLACEIFIDNHTNAGSPQAQGTEVYYCYGSNKGMSLASYVYNHIAPLSPGEDRGIMPDTALYASGLYVLRNTQPPAILIEHIFHTNLAEVNDFILRMDEYAKAEAKAVVVYFGESWAEPLSEKKSWKEIIQEISGNADEWQSAIETAVNAAKADGDLGALEIFEYLPQLIERIRATR